MNYVEVGVLQKFWAWWWPSIVAWLPARVQPNLLRGRHLRFIRWDAREVESTHCALDGDAETVLLLPTREVLIRSLQLPPAAATKLRDVAYYEVERQTPFSVEQVYFDAVPHPQSTREHPKLLVSLVVVPKQTLETAVEAIRTSTSKLIAVDVPGVDGVPLGANLLPRHSRYRAPTRWRNWNVALVAICGIAVIGISVGLLHARQRAIRHLERQADALLAQAAQIKRRQAALEKAQSMSLSSAVPTTALEMVSRLSAGLPLDSHLIHMELENGAITARGQTGNLSNVLRGLTGSNLWGDPELTGSRTLPDGKHQEFSLRLRLRQSAARAADG